MRNRVTASKSLENAATVLERRVAALRHARATGRGGGQGGCAACNHEQHSVITEALVAKVPLHLLAKTYGMSIAALSRHNKNHVSHSTCEQRIQVVLDRLIAKCDEFEAQAWEAAEATGGEASDEVIGVIDDLRQEVLAVKTGSRLWSP